MTYGTLKMDIADWLARPDLTARIPSFVALAEDMHRWGLRASDRDVAPPIRVDDMTRRATIAGNDTRLLPMPSSTNSGGTALGFSRVWLTANPDQPLTQVAPQAMANYLTEASGPRRYCYVRGELEFDYAIGTDGEVRMVYWEAYDRLTDDLNTNWLLENCYAAYLYGALMHAEPFLRNDQRAALWTTAYASAVSALQHTDSMQDWSQGQMMVTRAVAYR